MTNNLWHDLLHETVFERNIAAPKLLREYLVPEAGADFVAGGVASYNLDRRISPPVVLQGEKCKSQVLIRSLGGITGEEVISYENAGSLCVFRNSVHDTFRSALVDVVLPFEDFQPWWIDVEGEFLGEIRSISSKHIPK